jgi:F-type H+-transporting ATPase subunit gamma
MVIVKPSADEVLAALLKKHFSIQIFRIMLESQAGEHGARMSAMENATKNANEMIKKLTIQYNKQRQAGITKELLEIIAGSESAKAQA